MGGITSIMIIFDGLSGIEYWMNRSRVDLVVDVVTE